ncbi:MAG: methyltransferase domain-containing protein [Candidatus Solibacter sp.]|nr:methyltransferase domain-containing protein [Candidatus Solibacter sp.]
MPPDWNAGLYDACHSFVWEFGRDLLAVLAPQPGERILDVGCGTGHLTAEIAQAGATVLGVDRSAAMIAHARENFPLLRFEVQDVCELPYQAEFDAVFSSAVLHWVQPPEIAAAAMVRALKPGGRLVFELGGRGNIQILVDSAYHALRQLGINQPERFNPWYYPSVAEYSAILERCGIEVTFAHLFDRPTPLKDGERGLEAWFRMFGSRFMEPLDDAGAGEFLRLVSDYAAPHLLRDGIWSADYRRLRIAGRRLPPA